MGLAEHGQFGRVSMFLNPSSLYLIVVLIALAPGAVAWFSSRRLIHHINDPALPELLAGHRRRNGVMFVVAVTGCVWLSVLADGQVAVTAIGGGLFTYAGLAAAAYPLRRALYQETWSFLSYCLFYPRTLIGMFGFWIAVLALPELASQAGPYDWMVALGLVCVLVLWNVRYADVARWCLGTAPLDEGELLAACRALAVKCDLPEMRFDRIVLSGGVIANALALPSLRSPSVLFTETVLERFERQEILAICAHELAHFDHFNAKYLRRLRTRTLLLIAVGAIAAPVARMAGIDWGLLPNVCWLMAVVASLAARAKGRQRQETMCDLRAIELTGDSEALIRGLTKLYTLARLPRRVANQTEQSATHPSLSRRIRDIRKAAGSPPVPLSTTHTFTSEDGRSTAAFEEAGVRWVDGAGIAYTLSYAHLTELRVEVKAARAPRLVAVGPSARRWELPLRESDVASVQSVLDTVDSRLADPPPRKTALEPRMHKVIMLAMVTMSLSISQIGLALIALLAWFQPTMPLFVGAGIAAMVSAAFVLRDVGTGPFGELSWFLAILGLVFFGFAWMLRKAPRTSAQRSIVVLALAALCSIAVIGMHGTDAVALHRGARAVPSATVYLLALTGVLLGSSGRRARVAAVAVSSAALVLVGIASRQFLDRFGTDPFLVGTAPLRWMVLDAAPVQTFVVPVGVSRIGLSPNGRYIALYQNSDPDNGRNPRVQVGRIGDALTSIAADDVAFVGDDTLLVVRTDAGATTLTAERLDGSNRVMWQRVIENISQASLSVDRSAGRWALLGWSGDETIVRLEGGLDGSAVETHRWPVAQDRDGYIVAMTSAGRDALILETRYDAVGMARAMPTQWTWAQLLVPPHVASRYATLSEQGRQASAYSKLDVQCSADLVAAGTLACTAYDGSRTHIVTIGATARVRGVGFLEDRFVGEQRIVPGWLTGWVNGRPVAIHLPSGEAISLAPAARALRLIPVADDRLAALTYSRNQFEVAVYSPLSQAQPSVRIAQAQSSSDRH